MFHVKHEPWSRAGLDVDARQGAQLDRYEAMLRERALPLGMIARSDVHRLSDRHVLDSLRGAPLVPSPAGSVVDLGSGAGLPGIPIAIARPDASVVLVEARRNRAAFLELAVQEVALPNVRVVGSRVEDLPEASADVCLARAFAPLPVTWSAARRLVRPAGLLLYWAGRTFDLRTDALPDAVMTLSVTFPLADAGPIVIMTPQ